VRAGRRGLSSLARRRALLAEFRANLWQRRDAHGNTHAHAYRHCHANAYPHSDCYRHIEPYLHRRTHAHAYPYGHSHGIAQRNVDSHTNACDFLALPAADLAPVGNDRLQA
jgi:hypothetical protein